MSSDLAGLLRTLSARGATLACVQGALILRPKGVGAGLEASIRLWKPDLLRLAEAAGGVLGPQELGGEAAQGGSPWAYLEQVADQLAHRLWELQAPVVRVDINGRAVGYQSLEALNLEETRSLLRWLCATLEREYPKPEGIVSVLAQWPGRWPEKTRNVTLIQLEGGCLAI
ncbi:hypothetical protein Mesil_1577 [Allomeiothermus silvanus DSM 9946]|uniref:Uncharacterized protein n=1 Tax=Allomeiothermus silvanus (strain ATCC 700542 / DSM 9946 / NBRC 106475 / NCIMB 13440 / VI-R2) TaxID=526227 RepID=D7BFB4_ALLS1|nr:hypothetical protein [Allomeiothermus silvanus]ADH63467.1 hypothetical protein Mesil_1577 [Allomeiothermus silvanus DSM 9946]